MLIISSILGRINVWDFFFYIRDQRQGTSFFVSNNPFDFSSNPSTSLRLFSRIFGSDAIVRDCLFSLAFVYGNSTPVIIQFVFTAVRFHKLVEKMTFVLNNAIFISIYIYHKFNAVFKLAVSSFFHVPSIVLHYSAWCYNISQLYNTLCFFIRN